MTETETGPDAPAGARAGAGPGADVGELPLLAYRLVPEPPLRLTAPPKRRDWMDATVDRFANRCLPLLMANQSGWLLLSSHTFTAEWSGGPDTHSLRVDVTEGSGRCPAMSHFGHGILTFHVPFLFRTPPGWNLLVRGPANCPKDGIAALEGLVETDWTDSTFTMNWQLTRPGLVEFQQGEPVCMIVPQRRGDLERFQPEICDVSEMPQMRGYLSWRQGRKDFIDDLRFPDSEANERGWQREYMTGTAADGTRFAEHQRKLRLQEWTSRPPSQRRCG